MEDPGLGLHRFRMVDRQAAISARFYRMKGK